MDDKLIEFVKKYPSLIKVDSILSGKCENVALFGFYATPLASDLPNSKVVDLQTLTSSKWDCIIAPLVLSSMDRKAVVPFLFDLYDSLSIGGNLFLSFASLDKLEIVQGVERDSYHDPNLQFVEYKYRIEDVITALNTIGFKTREFDKVDTSFGSFITLFVTK